MLFFLLIWYYNFFFNRKIWSESQFYCTFDKDVFAILSLEQKSFIKLLVVFGNYLGYVACGEDIQVI